MMKALSLATLLISLSYSSLLFALPEDSEQPIFINSNSAMKDDKQGLTIYKGSVDMTQGTLRIDAEKITIYSNAEAVTKIIAEGKPAKLKQKPEIDKGDVTARASMIEYWVGEKKLRLSQNAHIDQDGSTIKGETIRYDMSNARIEADGGTETTPNKGRVQVVIPPRTTGIK